MARLASTIPILPSLDFDRTASWYAAKLGFQEVARYPDYLVRARDGHQVHFWACQDAALPRAVRPWGMKQFDLEDPDGNAVRFGEPV